MPKEIKNPCIVNEQKECVACKYDINLGCEDCPIFLKLPEEEKKKLIEKHDIYIPIEQRTIASYEVKPEPTLDRKGKISIDLIESPLGTGHPPYLVIGGDDAYIDYNEIPKLFEIFKELNEIYQKLKKEQGDE